MNAFAISMGTLKELKQYVAHTKTAYSKEDRNHNCGNQRNDSPGVANVVLPEFSALEAGENALQIKIPTTYKNGELYNNIDIEYINDY